METFAKRKNKLETWEETKIKPQYGSLNMFITVKDLKNKRTELFGKIVSLETDGTILILKYKKIEALFTTKKKKYNKLEQKWFEVECEDHVALERLTQSLF